MIAGSVHELHAERQRHAQDLLRLAFGLDDDGGDDRLAGLDAAVLAGEANLLGAGVLALQAEFGPGRVNQLNLLVLGLGASGGSAGSRRRGLLGGRSRAAAGALERLSGPPWRPSGLPRARRRRAGVWACAPEASSAADNAVAANKAKTRPRGRTDAAKIRKFIAENPF